MKFESQLQIVTAAGVPPFTVNQTAAVINLNSDLLDGQHGSYYQNADNLNAGTVAVARLSGSYNINITGSAGAATVNDTRNSVTGPSTGTRQVRFDFLNNSTDGLNDGGAWHGVMTFQQWGDASGGGTRQLGFTDNDNLWIRGSGTALTSYGSWKLLLNSANFSSYALPLTGGAMTGSSTISGDNHMTFGPNSTWSNSIRIGGNGYTATGTQMASVATTNGNLHLDSAKLAARGVYLNWYGGDAGTYFGNGSGGQVGRVDGSGNASFSGTLSISGTASFVGQVTGAYGPTTSFYGNSCDAASYNYVLGAANDGGNKLVIFVNGSTRSADGGVNSVTIRNDGGVLNLGSSSYVTNIYGSSVAVSGALSGTSASFSSTLAATGAITQGGNQVLHAGNYTTYSAPIAQTVYGDNSTATTVISENNLNTALKSGFYTVNKVDNSKLPAGATSVNFLLHTAYSGVGNLAGMDLLTIDSTTSDLYYRNATGGGKGPWRTVLTSANFNSYALPLTGGNLTGGLGVSGHITITSGGYQVRAGDGTVAAPGYSFSADTDTGIHRSADNTLELVTAGVTRATVGPTGTLNVVSALTQGGNQVLHAGNVSTYALPIGGGTLTGNLALNTGVIFNRGSAPSITNIQCSIFNELNGISNAESLNFRAYAGFKWQYWDGSATWMQLTSSGLSITGTLNATGAITQNGNQVLHAGNFNSYVLSASGTAPSLNIGGNAGSASALTTNTGSAASALQYWQLSGNSTLNPNTNWWYALRLSHGDADTYYSATLAVDFHNDDIQFRRKQNNVNQTWRSLLHSGNFNSYALPLTGGTLTGALAVNNDSGISTTFDSGASTSWYRGWGWETNRGTAYLRPVSNRTQDLYLGASSINSQDWRNVNFYASGTFAVNNNAILHAGNYTSYTAPNAANLPYSWTNTANVAVFSGSYGYNSGVAKYLLLWQRTSGATGTNGRFVDGMLKVWRGANHAGNGGTVGYVHASSGYSGQSSEVLNYTPFSGQGLTFSSVVYNSVEWIAVAMPVSDYFWEFRGNYGIQGDTTTVPILVQAGQAGVGAVTNLATGSPIITSSTYSLFSSFTGTVSGSNFSGPGTGLTGLAAGLSIGGNAATATRLTNLTSTTTSTAGTDNSESCISYINGISLFGQTDGALYSHVYSASWKHNIYGDYRTGQLAVRGKNNGTWQAWRVVLDASNYNSYALPLTGGTLTGLLTGTTGTQAKTDASNSFASTAFAKWMFATTSTNGVLDWNDGSNTIPGVGTTLLLGSATNGPGGGAYYHPLNIEYSSISGGNNVTQMAVSYGNLANELYMRGRYQGTWTSWIRFLNSSNFNSYALPLTGGTLTGALSGTSASFSGALSSGGNSVLTVGNYSSYAVDNTKRFKQFFWDSLFASGAQARRFEIARIGIDIVNWNGVGSIEIELSEDYYSKGLLKKYVVSYGYSGTRPGITLTQMSGAGDNNFQVTLGTEQPVSGNHYYLPIYVDVRYYAYTSVRMTTSRQITSNSTPPVGSTYINASPSPTNISDFSADSTVNMSNAATAWQVGGNTIVHAGNYTNYPPARWATGRTISLTGDVTGTSGLFDGTANLSFAATIANSSVTYAKIQNVAVSSVLGNSSASVAQAPQALSMATLASLLSGQTMNIVGSSTSCTGNAATATNVAWSGITSKPTTFSGYGISDLVYGSSGSRNVWTITDWNQTTYPNAHFLSSENNTTNAPTTDFIYGLQTSFHRSGASYRTQMVTELYSNPVSLWVRNSRDSDTWTSWAKLVHSLNYTDYTVTKTGAGASGSWGINITGSSASCSGSAAQLNGQSGSYYENRDTTSVSISAGTLTLGRGAGNLTTTLGGRTVAWCEFNGNFASSQTPNASFNVSSITKNATGDYTINFSSALANTNYVVAGYAQLDTTNNSSNYNLSIGVARRSGAKATGSCRIGCEYLGNATLYDSGSVGVAFIAA